MKLRPDQYEDLITLIANPRHGLWHEPAVGKTPTACVYTKYLLEHEGATTIWTQPKSIMEKNQKELIKWTGWNEKDVVIVDGNPAQVQRQLTSQAKVFLMGPARFRLSHNMFPDRIKAVVADEIHMKGFSGPESKQTEALYAFYEKQGKFFLPMSGTLINGKPDSAYPTIRLIEARYYGNYDQFKNFHHEYDPWTGYLNGYRNLEKLRQILLTHGIRRTFESIYGREAKVVIPEWIELAPRQRELYNEFEQTALLELERFFVDGTQPGVGFIRARQILEHPHHFPDLTEPGSGKTVDILDGELPGKEQRLELHFQDHVNTGEPVVVFAFFVAQQKSIAALGEKMGMRVAIMNGETPTRKRFEIDAAFRAGQIDLLVASPEVAGVGYNWQFAGDKEVKHCIFASMDYLDTSFLQNYRRFIRGKRDTTLRITVLMYDAEIERRVLDITRKKSLMASRIDVTRPELVFV